MPGSRDCVGGREQRGRRGVRQVWGSRTGAERTCQGVTAGGEVPRGGSLEQGVAAGWTAPCSSRRLPLAPPSSWGVSGRQGVSTGWWERPDSRARSEGVDAASGDANGAVLLGRTAEAAARAGGGGGGVEGTGVVRAPANLSSRRGITASNVLPHEGHVFVHVCVPDNHSTATRAPAPRNFRASGFHLSDP